MADQGGAGSRRDALLEAVVALAAELSLPAVLERVVQLAAEVTGARYGALGVLGPDGLIEQFITRGVSPGERARIGHPPVGHGILGLLIGEGRPIRLHDIAEHPSSVGFPPNHPPMHTFLGAPVKARGQVFGNIYLTEKAGGVDFTEEDLEALVVLATQAGVAVENARLYEEARARGRRLEAVREIATAILQDTEIEDVLQLVADRARELVGAAVATLATPWEEDAGSLVIRVVSGAAGEPLRGMVFPLERSVSGEVMRSGEAVVLEDARTDARAWQPMVLGGQMGPAMFVPMGTEGVLVGTLALANDPGSRAFSAEDQSLVETFAGQAAVAIQYGRARQEVQRVAVLEDRERIAKELHDGVIQSLFAVGMGLQGAAALSRDPELEERIEASVNEIDRVIRDLRNYIFGLRPGILADRQLGQALGRLVDEFAERTGIVTIADIDPRVAQVLTARAGDLVQLTREALSNVGRHSGAATCRVTLRRDDGQAVLEIDDDGRGFDVATLDGGGQGLPNLRSRAESFGGELDLDSVLDQGTTVRVRIPL